MGLLDRFRKKKEEVKIIESPKEETEFDRFFSKDPDVYDALKDFMFLDPRKIDIDLKEAEKRAGEFDKAGDKIRARVWYKIAGQLAIYEGNISKVKKLFKKYQELNPNVKLKILEIPDKAVKMAQEYYSRFLGSEKT